MADQRVVELFDGLAQVRRAAARRHVAVAEVLAGTEAAAFAGQQQHAHIRILAYLLEGFFDFAVHLRVEAVELVWAIEAEQGDAGIDGKEDVFKGHRHGGCPRCTHGFSAGSLLDRPQVAGFARVYL